LPGLELDRIKGVAMKYILLSVPIRTHFKNFSESNGNDQGYSVVIFAGTGTGQDLGSGYETLLTKKTSKDTRKVFLPGLDRIEELVMEHFQLGEPVRTHCKKFFAMNGKDQGVANGDATMHKDL
jgi:hypothetical protein